MELTKQDLEKALWELHRIGNAVEVLAMQADPRFVPMDESLRLYRRDSRRSGTPTKKTHLPEPGRL